MIVRPSLPLPAAEAARRIGRGRLPCWLACPGTDDATIGPEFVAADPVLVVRGDDPVLLESAWRQERDAWQCDRAGLPVGVGWLSCELGDRFERVRRRPRPGSRWPTLEFRFYDALWTRDSDGARILARNEQAADRLAALLADPTDLPARLVLGALTSAEPPEQHLAGVARVLAYLRAGDVYQVNLARRLTATVASGGTPLGWAIASRLRDETPAPHAIWLADPEAGRALVGNSPERFLRLGVDGIVETSPIKGTRPRLRGAADAASAQDLLASAKDRAEHVMIVDLERNDLGRVCETGSVRVRELARLLSLPTVHHLVSTVEGRLRPGVGLVELLRATFPGGSVTGAPKIRALEIIDELEPAPRGPYTGATGWLGAAGDLDLAIAIRTALIDDDQLTLWVGGGIVIDSVPEEELRETEAKAAAFARLATG